MLKRDSAPHGIVPSLTTVELYEHSKCADITGYNKKFIELTIPKIFDEKNRIGL